MKRFKNSNQLKSFLKRESERLNISINNVYHTYIARTLLQRMSKYNAANFIVKGSSAEILYLGKLVRAITDIDLVTLSSYKAQKNLFHFILEDNSFDDFKFKLLHKEKQTKTGIHKLTIYASFGTINQPLNVDIEQNYQRLINLERRIMPAIFEGDDPFEMYVPSFEEYMAEKLCIIVESRKEDVLNTRLKDFYDIYQLHGGKYNPEVFTEYFRKMLLSRGKIPLERAMTSYLNTEFILKHLPLWENTRRKYDFLDKEVELDGVVYYTRAVIREQLQKTGQEMDENVHLNPTKKIIL